MKVKTEIKEKIIAAANALATEGIESPTNDQVRERMDSGSLSPYRRSCANGGSLAKRK